MYFDNNSLLLNLEYTCTCIYTFIPVHEHVQPGWFKVNDNWTSIWIKYFWQQSKVTVLLQTCPDQWRQYHLTVSGIIHNTTKGLVYYCKRKIKWFWYRIVKKKIDEIVRNFLSGLN